MRGRQNGNKKANEMLTGDSDRASDPYRPVVGWVVFFSSSSCCWSGVKGPLPRRTRSPGRCLFVAVVVFPPSIVHLLNSCTCRTVQSKTSRQKLNYIFSISVLLLPERSRFRCPPPEDMKENSLPLLACLLAWPSRFQKCVAPAPLPTLTERQKTHTLLGIPSSSLLKNNR